MALAQQSKTLILKSNDNTPMYVLKLDHDEE
jgi:hypothetical protein